MTESTQSCVITAQHFCMLYAAFLVDNIPCSPFFGGIVVRKWK
jgi:hypothetical protein